MSPNSEPLVRRGRRNSRYTSISNDIIDHSTLSPDARIALMYLLSKPDDWRLQVNDLRRVLGTGDKPCGRNKTYEVIRELKLSAYVVAVHPGKGGRYSNLIYFIFDEPLADPDEFRREQGDRKFRSQSAKTNGPSPKALSPCPEIRDAVLSPRPGFRDPVSGDLTKNRKKQITEIPPPSPRRTRDRAASRAGPDGEGFFKFWEAWPASERPRSRAYAQRLFDQLTPDDQQHACEFASQYRSAQNRRDAFAAMIFYLRDRLFLEFVDGPQLASDGYLRITPDRPEWSSWMSHIEAKHGANGRAKQEALGYVLSQTRWPDGASAPSKTSGGVDNHLSLSGSVH
jgi:hypothetical protein